MIRRETRHAGQRLERQLVIEVCRHVLDDALDAVGIAIRTLHGPRIATSV
jgi:hypothetical protein